MADTVPDVGAWTGTLTNFVADPYNRLSRRANVL